MEAKKPQILIWYRYSKLDYSLTESQSSEFDLQLWHKRKINCNQWICMDMKNSLLLCCIRLKMNKVFYKQKHNIFLAFTLFHTVIFTGQTTKWENVAISHVLNSVYINWKKGTTGIPLHPAIESGAIWDSWESQ